MRVGVVGAGLAGLGAARALAGAGHEVVVLEKSRGLGGRMASRRVGVLVLDHGSPVLAAPPGSALRDAIDALGDDGVGEEGGGLTHPAGATRIPKALAEGLDVRRGVRLAALREHSAGLELGDEQGNTQGVVDAVVVTAPAPQAADLIARSPEAGDRVEALRGLAYAPAVMVLVGVAPTGEQWDVRRPRRGPVAEVRREAVKGRPPADGAEGLVARLDEGASEDLLDASDEAVLETALPALAEAAGPGAARPLWAQVKRWRLAVPRGSLDEARVNPPGARIVVAGDTLTGAAFGGSDHHRAFASGIAAALRVAGAAPVAAR